jgi:hypothetical protein
LVCSVKAKEGLQETYYQISAWRSCAGAGKSANACSLSRALKMFKTVTALQNQPYVVIQTPAACVLYNHASTHTPLTAIPTERCKCHGPLPVCARFYGASRRTAESSLSENHFYAVTGMGGWGDKIGTHSRVLNGRRPLSWLRCRPKNAETSITPLTDKTDIP